MTIDKKKLNISGNYLIRAIVLLSGIWIILYYGSVLILPLLIAILLATLLNRPTERLKKWGFPKWLAILVSLIVTGVVLFLLFWLITSQIGSIADDWPKIEDKATEKYNMFSSWLQQTFQIDAAQVVSKNVNFADKLKGFSKIFFTSFTSLFSQLLLTMVYTVLFLLQKAMFIGFFEKLVNDKKTGAQILIGASKSITDYMFGKALVMLFLFVIYYLGFIFGDVPFALFLALFASIFSIIPYVGNLAGGGVAVILAYLYSGNNSALIVIAVIGIAQLMENYILTPMIIGDKIDLNPFMTIFGVILFSTLWGLVGAIIALPILAVVRVFLQNVNGMEAYAYLLEKHDG